MIINDLLGKKSGLDSVGVDIFKSAKRRLLNTMLLAKVKESKEFQDKLSEDVRNKIDSFVSLTVNYFLLLLLLVLLVLHTCTKVYNTCSQVAERGRGHLEAL